MGKLTMNSANPDAKRFMVDGHVIGFALGMSGGTWCLYDTNDQRIDPRHFKTPARAFTAFKSDHADRIIAGRAALQSQEPTP